MSYSFEKRRDLRERALNASELDGDNTRPLFCSHNTHLKEIPEYNNNEYGLLVNDIQHYAYHLIFRGKPYVKDVLGLTYAQNQWSLNAMWQDLMCISEVLGISKEETLAEIEKAKLYWYAFLGIDPLEG